MPGKHVMQNFYPNHKFYHTKKEEYMLCVKYNIFLEIEKKKHLIKVSKKLTVVTSQMKRKIISKT